MSVPSFLQTVALQGQHARVPDIAANGRFHHVDTVGWALKELSKVTTGKYQHTSQAKFGISQLRGTADTGDLSVRVSAEKASTDVEPSREH
jgi:hypothetical protein